MANTLDNASPLLKTIVIGALIAGVLFSGVGVWLVYLGASGETRLTLIGQSLKSTNVGIASVFVGGVIVVVTLRRVLRTIELGITHAVTESKISPAKKSVSGKQRALLQAIASAGDKGIYAGHLGSDLDLDREAIVYRAKDLESQELITIESLTDYLYRVTRKGLQELGMP